MAGNGKGGKKTKKMHMSVNLDTTPIFYTDNIQMTANKNGVVLDVIQRLSSSDQARIVTRIGMSKEHARDFVEKLGKLLINMSGVTQTGKDKSN
jgi:hypothetical protein